MEQIYELDAPEAMITLGIAIGKNAKGGEVLELTGDVGAGKTTFVKGLARGLGIEEVVQSPTFTISRVYQTPSKLRFCHYDFYRLAEPGILREELAEVLDDQQTVTALEWDDTVQDVLPAARTVQLAITSTGEHSRHLVVRAPRDMAYLIEGASV